ncbi:MAG: rhomboid family intramembrane serine protease [Candidatus Obscuribacterales bacterium]
MKNQPWATAALLLIIIAVAFGFGVQFNPWEENQAQFSVFINQHSLSAVPNRVLAFYSPTYFLQAAGGYVTALFIHHGWLHVMEAVYPLAFLGASVERAYGWKGLLIAFFVGGIGGEIGSSAMLIAHTDGNGNMGTIGASPAMYAIVAFFIVAYAQRWKAYWLHLLLAIGILGIEAYTILDLLSDPNVKNASNHASHVSGFLIGLVLAFWLCPTRTKKLSVAI